MATCTVETGFLFWKKACGAEAMGACRGCGSAACQRHCASFGDGTLLCARCRAETDDSSSTVFTTSAMGVGAAAGASAVAASSQAESGGGSWHGNEGDSGGGFDSGGGDSGGGDSGGSSSD